MQKQRTIQFTILFTILLVGLIFRLAQIQLISTESFSSHHVNLLKESVQQRTQSWQLDSGRGRFVDQHGDPINYDVYPMLILFPFLQKTDWPVDKIAAVINENPNDLVKAINNANQPFVYRKLTESQYEAIQALNIPGVFALHQTVEKDATMASHLIGITRQNEQLLRQRYPEKVKNGSLSRSTKIGITGLQQSFDEFVLPDGEAKLLYHVDNKGGPLFGLNVKYSAPANPYYPTKIKTTLNNDLQKLAEQAVDQTGLEKGGLVLLDVKNSNILAMVSRPNLNPVNPFDQKGGTNQMIVPQIPGSVFKTVTAAAALDKNVNLRGRTFNCDRNLYGDGPSDRQLGDLTFAQSFAQSCNFTFATIAGEMVKQDPSIIETYANKLGLIDPVGWQGDVFHYQNFVQIPGEGQGRIWGDERDKAVSRAIAQTAIGQKEVRVTPLAIANMMATIARGGEKKQVRAVQAIEYKNNTTLFDFPEQALIGDRISSYAATNLQNILRKVVTEGTGRRLKSLPLEVAGKSGTAQTGKKGIVNSWFAGYFPANAPRYALVVTDLDQAEYQTKTIEVYAKLVQDIDQYEQTHP